MTQVKTIVPWNMTQDELTMIVSSLSTAKSLGCTHAKVLLGNGMEYKVSVDDIDDYINELNVEE